MTLFCYPLSQNFRLPFPVVVGESLDTKFTLTLPVGNPRNLERPFPGPITLRSALMKFADLTSPTQKCVLPALAAFAGDEVSVAVLTP